MNAVITGVTGFAGRHLAEHLLACGDTVLGVSRSGAWPADASHPAARVPLFKWDLARHDTPSDAALRQLAALRPNCIYHLAALSVPADCGQEAPTPAAQAANVDGTRRVLAMAAGLPGPPRIVFVSSSHVYAPVARQAPVVNEESPLGPARGYGMTKLAAENLVRDAVSAGRIEAVIARAFQHTGPGQGARMMLPQWAEQFAHGCQPVQVYTRDAYIDLTDVRDVVRAYRLLAQSGRTGITYNIGSGICRRSGDVFEALRGLVDASRGVVELRPGVRQDPIADHSRLTMETGWRPEIAFERTVADVWQDWRTRPPRAAASAPTAETSLLREEKRP